jgi:hypothetical protein
MKNPRIMPCSVDTVQYLVSLSGKATTEAELMWIAYYFWLSEA